MCSVNNRLHKAAQEGQAEEIRRLIAKGEDVNGRDINKVTPLFWAAFSTDLDVARQLVAAGADVNYPGPKGTTPLYNALHKRNAPLALWLLEQDANPLAADENGNTMLHLASIQGMEDPIAALLARGADVNACNANGQTPLALCLLPRSLRPSVPFPAACVFLLLDAGATHDPIPGLGISMEDYCARKVAVNILNEVLPIWQKTARNPDLAALAATLRAQMEARALQASLADDAGNEQPHARELGADDADDDQDTLYSSVLGPMHWDGFFWASTPTKLPFYHGEPVIILYDVEPDDDPKFLAEADNAVTAFLKLDDTARLALSCSVADFAITNLEAAELPDYDAKGEAAWVGLRDMSVNKEWLDQFVAGHRPVEEVWSLVGDPINVFVARSGADKAVYVAMQWQCMWDVEHQFQISFRKGKTLARISANDGDLAD